MNEKRELHSLKDVKAKIEKEGVEPTIQYLLSDSLKNTEKADLTKCNIFNKNGYLHLSLVYSL